MFKANWSNYPAPLSAWVSMKMRPTQFGDKKHAPKNKKRAA